MAYYSCLFILSIFVGLALSEDIKDLNFSELLQLAQDASRPGLECVKDDEVTYLLLTRSLREGKIVTNETNIDLDKPTKIIIHGWIANMRRSWYKVITEEFLKNGDYNVVQVDWEKPARSAYVSSAANAKFIGMNIAKFVTNAKIPPQNIHMVGHSLGAHIAGFAAKQIYQTTNSKVSRISGLDPAGPYFQEHILDKQERLHKKDADVVDVMHTDGGVYGIAFPLGTVDIYVNNGRAPQPGCSIDFNVNSFGGLVEKFFCSHASSIEYFAEWINDGKFHCKLCSSWTYFVINLCPKTLDLREEEVDRNVTGICATRTNPVKPFLEHGSTSEK
ncbi:phospholipase A1-like [Anoplophora glabripennis]|uniref:phospholipase A1-like n=1 Tax=Anoplophora glabripennis TaxID=217634 RepID=UPI000875276F|nr:phospholipase A1-like [Anoplophora glabripennis]